MQFRVRCKKCESTLRVTEKYLGKTVRCPKCEAPIRIPEGSRKSDDDVESNEFEKVIRAAGKPAGKRTPSRSSKSNRQPINPGLLVASGAGVALVAVGLVVLGVTQFRQAKPAPVAQMAKPVDNSQTAPASPPPAATTASTATEPNNQNPSPVIAASASTPTSISGTGENTKPAAEKSEPAAETTISVAKVETPKADSSSSNATTDIASLIDQVGKSVVLIKIADANGKNLGLGSGFVINKEGLVATNFHVLKEATTAEAEFRDGTRCAIAGYRAHDENRDIAIVQLENPPGDLEPLEFAEKSDVRQGSSVIAMGHPRGLRFTATEGIVSAIHQTSELPEDLRDHLKSPDDQVWIQTNATIFSGNSGGPLLTRSGKVVGINSWITRDVNFGFALAIQHLADLMNSMKEGAIPLAEVNKQGSIDGSKLHLGQVDSKIQDVLSEYKLQLEEFNTLLSMAKTREDYEKVYTTKNPARKHVPSLMKIASESSKTQTAYQALIYSISLLRQYYPESSATSHMQQATTQLLRDHLDEKSMGTAAMMLADCKMSCVQSFLRELLQKSPERDVQGITCFVLGRTLSQSDNAAVKKESIKLLQRVINDFSDVLYLDKPIIESAEPLLFELEHLSVGSEAPEIVGHDAEGNEFRLSDYRGKVVMLDFFADWCPYCKRMYPAERIFVERTQDQPLVLLGVNCDKEGKLKKLIKDKQVTWQCWADGEGGPIATEWRVDGYPRIYLIDHEGIIRHRFDGAPEVETLDTLLTQMTNAVSGKAKPKATGKRKPRK